VLARQVRRLSESASRAAGDDRRVGSRSQSTRPSIAISGTARKATAKPVGTASQRGSAGLITGE